jgi:hypothetical protein
MLMTLPYSKLLTERRKCLSTFSLKRKNSYPFFYPTVGMAAARQQLFHLGAKAIRNADALLVTAGAGIGVDSGLPDFRGNEGFWQAYPPLKDRGIGFQSMANPMWFESESELAWFFIALFANATTTTPMLDLESPFIVFFWFLLSLYLLWFLL